MITKQKINKRIDYFKNKAMMFIIAFALLFTYGCGDDNLVCAEFANINDCGWAKDDVKKIEIIPIDSVNFSNHENRCNVILTLRYNSDYEYKNIWLETMSETSTTKIETDTIELLLVDCQGKWEGKGYGGMYELSDTILRNISIDDFKSVKIRHIMTDSLLKGIENVGIIVINQKKK